MVHRTGREAEALSLIADARARHAAIGADARVAATDRLLAEWADAQPGSGWCQFPSGW